VEVSLQQVVALVETKARMVVAVVQVEALEHQQAHQHPLVEQGHLAKETMVAMVQLLGKLMLALAVAVQVLLVRQ
jgi:hypothetical protein